MTTPAPPPPSWLRPGEDGAFVEVVVVPRAGRSELAGEHDGRLRVRLAAPPVEGAANRELVEFLARLLKTAKSNVTLTAGQGGRRKTVHVRGMSPAALHAALSGA